MSASAVAVEQALVERRPVDEVLDLADEVIEAGGRGELEQLARLLDDFAKLYGGPRGLTIAAARARAALPHDVLAEALPELRYAGWWQRAGAFALDWGAIVAGIVSLAVVDADLSLTLGLLLPTAYFTALHGLNEGQSLGKLTAGVAVRAPDGGTIGLGRAFIRAAVQGTLWLTVIGGLIDSLAPVGDSRHRALHDMIAGTVVLRVR